MPKYCPECNHELTDLNYSCDYTEWGTEDGTCDLEGNDMSCDDRNGNDSETNEIVYQCPYCEHDLDLDNLLDEPMSEEQMAEINAERNAERNARISRNTNRPGFYCIDPSRPPTQSRPNNIDEKFPYIECPSCHKVNYRGNEDRTIICDNCNEEIIIN